jgi:hypothetical protein
MKAMESRRRNTFFADVLDVIAESLGRPPAATPRPNWLTRIGVWLWSRQVLGVDAYIARADAMFEALDRWLWKQRMRETEAWLAQSQDRFELEARIRELERRPSSGIY